MTTLHHQSQLEVPGAETYVESLVGELNKRGHRFLVASNTGSRVTARTFRDPPDRDLPGLTRTGFMRKISGYYHRYRRMTGR